MPITYFTVYTRILEGEVIRRLSSSKSGLGRKERRVSEVMMFGYYKNFTNNTGRRITSINLNMRTIYIGIVIPVMSTQQLMSSRLKSKGKSATLQEFLRRSSMPSRRAKLMSRTHTRPLFREHNQVCRELDRWL